MKRAYSIVLVLLLVASLVLVGCQKDPGEGTETTETSEPAVETTTEGAGNPAPQTPVETTTEDPEAGWIPGWY